MRSSVHFALGAAVLFAGTAACTAILGIDDLPSPDGGPSTEAGTHDASLGDGMVGDGAVSGDSADGSGDDGMTDASFDGGPVSGDGSFLTTVDPLLFQPLPGLQATSPDLHFGAAVAISPADGAGNEWIAIGAPGAGDITTGASSGRGGVQVIHLLPNPDTISYDTFLLGTKDTAAGSGFGSAVAFSPDGRFLAVGAPRFPAGGSTTITGAVYLFLNDGNGTDWRYITYAPVPPDSPTLFGSALAFMIPPNLSGGVVAELLVGAPGVGTGGVVSVYQVTDSIVLDAGADAGDADLVARNEHVTHTTTPVENRFGASVAANVDGTVILIGAPSGENLGGMAYLTTNGSFADAAALVPVGPVSAGMSMYGTSLALTGDGRYAAIGGPAGNVAELRTIDAAPPITATNRSSIAPEGGAGDGGAGFGTCVAVTTTMVYAGAPLDPAPGNVVMGAVNGTAVSGAASLLPFTGLLPTTAGLGTACAANARGDFVVSAPGTGAPAVYIFH